MTAESRQVESEEFVNSETTFGNHAVGAHGWLFRKNEYEKGSIIKRLKERGFFSFYCADDTLATPMTRLPKHIEPVDDLSDRSKAPRKQPLLLAFYENLKSEYKLHQKEISIVQQ